MQYPVIDPNIFSIDFLSPKWYGLMYLIGFAIAWALARYRANRLQQRYPQAKHLHWSQEQISDLIFYGAMGAVLGGRVGYVLSYNFGVFLDDPLYLFRITEGGMSFHGGVLGVALAVWLLARKQGRTFVDLADFTAPIAPIGLGCGRVGNFINMELPGRVTDSAFGFIYKCDAVRGLNAMCAGEWESAARHPSPLYQAFAEGIVLFVIVWLVSLKVHARGVVAATFLVGYAVLRFLTEFFRSPDAHIGFVALDWLTMGQILSLPMAMAGILLVWWTSRQRAA